MVCCRNMILSLGQEDWYNHCLSCKRVHLRPIKRGFIYFKAQCPRRYLPDGTSVSCTSQKSLAHPYYRIPATATHFTCEECYREFLVEEEFVDDLTEVKVHMGPLAEQAYYSVIDDIKAATNTIRKSNEKKQTLKMRMAHLLRDTRLAAQKKKKLETVKEQKDNEKLEQLEKINSELKNKVEMLLRLKEVRKAAPEITLSLMEIASVKNEISRVRPLQETELKKATEMEREYLEKKEEFETVTSRHEMISKQHRKLEKTKFICDQAQNEYAKLEEQRSTKLEEISSKFEQDKKNLDERNSELNKMHDISLLKLQNLLDEIEDLQTAQKRQSQVPLFQLLQLPNLAADSLLVNLKKRAESLRDKDSESRAIPPEVFEEAVEVKSAEDLVDFSVPCMPSAGTSAHVDETLSEATEEAEEEEFFETSSEDSFELIKKTSSEGSAEEDSSETNESDDEDILFD